jgi:hypothetical protein
MLKRWEVILIEFMEPFQLIYLGGSQMAYLRHKADTWHKMAHDVERIAFIVQRM